MSFKIADAYVEIHANTATLAPEVKAALDEASVEAEAGGRKVGDSVSKGAGDGAKGASPLIVAAISGGLAAGAPVVLAAAGVMFAGIAAAAVASNQQVSDTFKGMTDSLEGTLKTSAASAVPIFVGAMGQIQTAFQGLAPQLTAAFSSIGPIVDGVTQGIIGLVQNAMPGLVSAVQNSAPVFQGLASALSTIGQGVGDFFSILSQHSGTAGTALKAIGDIVGAILPILGQLVSAGSDLASTILPPLAAALQGVAAAVNVLAPVLPGLMAGFAAFKGVSALTGVLDTFTGKLQGLSENSGSLVSKLAGAGSAISSGIGTALPIVGAAVTVATIAFTNGKAQVDNWAQAMLNGGAAADKATQQIKTQQDNSQRSILDAHSLGDAWNIVTAAFDDGSSQLRGYNGVSDEASQKAKALYDAMTPMQKVNQDVTTAQNNLNDAVATYGQHSPEAIAAADKLAAAQSRQKSMTDSVTEAAKKASDAAQTNTEKIKSLGDAANTAAQDANSLNNALKALTGGTVDTMQSQAAFEGAVAKAADSVKGQSGALLDMTGHLNAYTDKGRSAIQFLTDAADKGDAYIKNLSKQGASASDVIAADNNMRAEWIKSAQQLGLNADQAGALADQILGIPTQRDTQITMEADQAKKDADAVKQKVEAIPKTVNTTVSADGTPAANVFAQIQTNAQALANLDPTVIAKIDWSAIASGAAAATGVTNTLGAQTPTPTANLNTTPLRTQTSFSGSLLANLAGMTPTPTANLNGGPLSSVYSQLMGQIGTLNAQHPKPVATVVDDASGTISVIQSGLGALHNKTVTITTQHIDIGTTGRGTAGLATGGNVGRAVGKRFDVGGLISGPGGGTDDAIQAMTYDGTPLRVSNQEWIIREAAVSKYGDRAMAAVNAGTATITTPGMSAPATSTRTGGVTVQNLNLNVSSSYDFSNPVDKRKFIQEIRDGLVRMEREYS